MSEQQTAKFKRFFQVNSKQKEMYMISGFIVSE